MTDNEQDLRTLYGGPLTWNDRVRIRFQRLFCCKVDDYDGPKLDEPTGKVRIAPKEENDLSFKTGYSLLVNGAIEKWTNLLYRSTYGTTFVWFIFVYFICNVFNSAILLCVVIAYDNHEKECLNGWNYELEGRDRVRENFEIAFSLAWTTFSTVGYGTISPPDDHGCFGLRFLLSFIAFTGILFSGFCGAIFYSKVSRQTSVAKVTFSSAACLQFGKGITDLPLLVTGDDQDNVLELNPSDITEDEAIISSEYISDLDGKPQLETSVAANKTKGKTIPYPVVDFRVVNDKMKLPGNDLLKVSLTCVALSLKPSRGLKRALRSSALPTSDTAVDLGCNEPATKVYTKLKVTPSYIPIFDTAFYCRHVLDETSPLVEPSVKKKIAELGGWPSTINDYISIRNSISKGVFEIGISLEATSDLTAEAVFKLHRYTIEDLYVGWRFVGLCRMDRLLATDFFRTRQNPTAEQVRDIFDLDRIHMIMPQRGGGNEPLERTAEHQRRIFDMGEA